MRTAGSAWREPERLDEDSCDASLPALVVDAFGHGTAVWVGYGELRASRYEP